MTDEELRIEVDEYVEASPDTTFDYIADPERRPFGDGDVEFGDEVERDAPSRIAWEVTTADGETRRGGTVEIAVTPDGSGSRVRVTHRIGRPVTASPHAELALAA